MIYIEKKGGIKNFLQVKLYGNTLWIHKNMSF
jgi:hypothetical protein